MNLLRPQLMKLLFVALATACSARSPNIILVMCDDLGWGDVGFNGNTVIRTPHLDAMAADGLVFNRFYAAAPVCSPTRGSVITGRHPFRYGVYHANVGHMKAPEITLAELLRARGYHTGHFGKWHLGTLTKTGTDANRGGPQGVADYSPPQDNGFDTCFSTESKVPTWDPRSKPKAFSAGESLALWWAARDDDTSTESYGTAYWNEDGEQVTGNMRGDDSRVIMDRVLPFITSAAEVEAPFFAIVWFHTPHLPVVAGASYAAIYSEFDGFRQQYFGSITAMDEQVGRLRATLRTLGVANDTMVWFCSDNGPEGKPGDPGLTGGFRGRKRSLYEGGIRVPGLLEWPAVVKGGGRVDVPASTLDYLPTILARIGVALPDDRPLDGMDLAPVWTGEMKERPGFIGFQSDGNAACVTHQYKLLVPLKGGAELYDLIADPFEAHDMASERPGLVATLRGELETWQDSCRRSDEGGDYPVNEAAKSD